MLKAEFCSYLLRFKLPSGTSRGVLNDKPTWFIKLWNSDNPFIFGIGECSPIKGLSRDPIDKVDQKLKEVCAKINELDSVDLKNFPCIKFGLEIAINDLKNGGNKTIFNNSFSKGETSLKINGLIWMDTKEKMLKSIGSKIKEGFNCLKLKIGAINFNDEIELIKLIRNEFSLSDLEIRVDANGAFKKEEAMKKIDQLSKFHLHSIEQPIAPNQHEELTKICAKSAIPIALDEELISISEKKEKEDLLKQINPTYIILKPSLLGGLKATNQWIDLAKKYDIGWWMTSALESNIGLNAIAQFTAQYNNPLPQGLGTGKIYNNNLPSFLHLNGDLLSINRTINWDTRSLPF